MRNITVVIIFFVIALVGLTIIEHRAKKHDIDAEQWLAIWFTGICIGVGIAYLFNNIQMSLTGFAFVWRLYHMSENIRHKEKIKWKVNWNEIYCNRGR